MTPRLSTNVKLLIVLAILGVAAGVKALVGGKSLETGESVKATESLFPTLKKEDISAVLIEAPESKRHELARDGEHWNVVSEGGARADKNDVNKVLDGITRLKQGRVRSSRGDVAKYGLDETKRTHVTVWGREGRSAAPIAQFSLAKIENDWRNVFLKLPGKDEIRVAEGSLGDFEPGTDDTWRDKTMYEDGTADSVSKIEITGPKGTLVLARRKLMGPKEPTGDAADDAGKDETTGDASADEPGTEGAEGDAAKSEPAKPEEEVKETYWVLEAPADAVPDPAAPPRAKKWLCDSIAGYVAKLECESFGTDADKPAEIGLDPPQYRIRAMREGETEFKDIVLLGNKNKDGKYAAKLPAPDSTQVWWVASWKGDYLTKSVDDLLETPPAKPEDKPADGDEAKPAESAEPKPDGEAAPDSGDDTETKPAGDAEKDPADDTAEPKSDDDGAKPTDDGAKPADDGAQPPPDDETSER